MLYDPNWQKSEPKQLTKQQQVLLNAAEKIEKYGHIKNDMGAESRGYCLSGAIRAASFDEIGYTESDLKGYTEDRYALHTGGLTAVCMVMGMPYLAWHEAIHWNNELERTKGEVVDVLRKAAAYAV
jgi:hypothetical protein